MIYLDNAATSFHKPDCVLRAVVEAMQHAGNSGRGSSRSNGSLKAYFQYKMPDRGDV